MNKLRQSLRRKKPTYVPEASRPHQWQADEEAVRKGKCNFPVRVSIEKWMFCRDKKKNKKNINDSSSEKKKIPYQM